MKIYIFLMSQFILVNRAKYFSPEENQLFSNVRICLSQISRADSKSLWAMITLQGGKCQLHLDRYCTHLITGKANGVKYETATRHHIPIVTPDWVTECCKKNTLISEVEYHPRLLMSPNSSTAMITGFMDEDTDNNVAQEEQDRTKAMLEQLKQRMPWNQPSPPVSSSTTHSLGASSTATVSYSTNGQNTVNMQSQQIPRPVSSSLGTSANVSVPSVSDQNVNINQTNWLSQPSQQSNVSQQIKTMPPQMQQQELSQQQINMQHQLIQQPLTSQQSLTQQQLTQHQQQLQQPSYNQQQILNQQLSPQVQQQQQLIGQQQSLMPQQQPQQINSQLSQHQLTAQQQQLLTSQQKQLNQHQIIQQQQLNQQQLTQQSHLTPQQQQVQLATQQQQQQIVMQQQQQQLPSQQQQIANQHQLTQQQAPPQQLAAEQRQLILLQQQQQQQKIQQISQQLQQSAPQSSQFVIRDGQVQQQQQNQQLIGPNQQGFIVKRDPQWQQQQQQQYHLQLQQRQQQIGPLRSEAQWNQLPRHLIQLDKQTHLQLQQMDTQQRSQFIVKLQKQRNLILQRQMHNRQQGPHIAVIRNPGKPVQSTSLQWIPQVQPQMGPQLTPTPGQKPVHSGVQPPALTPINSSNPVIVPTGQAVQGPQVSQTGQTFQQGQLIPQQLVQLQLQKQQQMARLQQLHLQQQQQQQQQQGAQQETPLTSLSNNAHIPPDQQLVVNAKTKTALANMLTNRLQGGATEGSAAGQLRLMTAQHRPPPPPSQDPQLLAAYQRRTLGNITNGALSGVPIKMQYPPVIPQPKTQFFGHNPNLKCMCLFFILLL